MSYCYKCGKEIVDGVCDCMKPQLDASDDDTVNLNYKQPYDKSNDPWIIPKFVLKKSSFSSLVSSVRDFSGLSDAASVGDDPFERNVPIVPDCIAAEENEIVVKQYNVAKLRSRLKFMKAEGRLMVTNRRVLFRATGTSLTGNIAQEHQFNLDEIAGIEIIKDYKFSLLNLILGILANVLAFLLVARVFQNVVQAGAAIIGFILGCLAVAPTFIVYKRFGLKLVGAIFGTLCFMISYSASNFNGLLKLFVFVSLIVTLIDLIIVCFVPNLVFKIKTKGAANAILIKRQKSLWSFISGDEGNGFSEVLPWDDTMMAMNELGTMIDDLQKHGDYAIEKWTR